MRVPDRIVALVLAAALALAPALAGCVTKPVPASTIRSPQLMEQTAWGAFVRVTTTAGTVLVGELIAVDAEDMYVLSSGALYRIPVRGIARAQMAAYDTNEGTMTAWGVVGTLSTLSHGIILLLSSPVWMLATIITARSESTSGVYDYPDDDRLPAFAKFARFPQGLPPGVDEAAVMGTRPRP